jgi:hypothetical protein
MTRDELEHAIRAACDVADDAEVWVFGSQSILGEHPEAPRTVRQSIEVDITPRNHPDRVDLIDGALGEYSVFHETYGFYVHGVSIESAILPAGWEGRAIPVSGRGIEPSTGWCIEGHDLAASKLAASREQDHQFVRTLIIENLVETTILIQRVQSLAIESERIKRISMWIKSNSV